MAEASAPQDLAFYEYEPSCPLPSGPEARDHVISKGPCLPKDINFPLDNHNLKFLVSWYEKFPWLEYSVSWIKLFVSCAEYSTHRWVILVICLPLSCGKIVKKT